MEVWASGAAYERYMGRWSRGVAKEFVAWLDRPDGLRWLDVGCGTGVLSAVVGGLCRPRLVLGVDRSEAFVGTARASVPAPAAFLVGDAMALPVRAAGCDTAVSGLALNFLPDPAGAVAEMARAVRPGGTVAAYVWDYAEGMELLRLFWDTAVALDPAAAPLDEGRRFPVCRPGPLRAVWTDAGLTRVSVLLLSAPTVFTGLPDLWDPFLSGQGPAPGYVATLPPGHREELRTALAAALPRATDGSLPLTARAWAVRGCVP
ncbi:class I SAM-dependent methyltransferase [Streptomyces sp. NPDC005811]|uniref:class I SAM-dependent methyltransferase n=1 Tax=Streptomyces sp. NPDC005811 TaxID=3154565 RepID=UPI0033F2229F